MSVVVKRNHPSGEYGLTVDHFPGKVVLGQGPLRGDMHFVELSPEEALTVSMALGRAATGARGLQDKED